MSFKINRGVGQGDLLSPNLFNAVLKHIFRQLKWKGKGLKIKAQNSNLFEFTWLNELRFADDVVLIARNGVKLEEMAGDLARIGAEMGLSINKSKTMILTNIKNLKEIRLEGDIIKDGI